MCNLSEGIAEEARAEASNARSTRAITRATQSGNIGFYGKNVFQ